MGASSAERFSFELGGMMLDVHRGECPGKKGGFGFVLGIRMDTGSAWQASMEKPGVVEGGNDMLDLVVQIISANQR